MRTIISNLELKESIRKYKGDLVKVSEYLNYPLYKINNKIKNNPSLKDCYLKSCALNGNGKNIKYEVIKSEIKPQEKIIEPILTKPKIDKKSLALEFISEKGLTQEYVTWLERKVEGV